MTPRQWSDIRRYAGYLFRVAALFRRQENHARKLEHGGDKLEDNPSEEWPKCAEERSVVQLQEVCCYPEDSEQIKTNRVARSRCICRRSKRRKVFVIVIANSKETTNANPLHHLQIPGGIGLIVSNSSPIMQRPSGRIELASKSRSRSLSADDHSCTDSRRKTTTTPAKPASATAICAAMLSASPGSIVRSVQMARSQACLFSVCSSSYATELLYLCATENSQ